VESRWRRTASPWDDEPVSAACSDQPAHSRRSLAARSIGGKPLGAAPDKTRIANCRKKASGFEILGDRFERGRRDVRKTGLDKLKETIRMKTKRTRGQSLTVVVADLNRMLRGWFGDFKPAHP
jgi:RNA-directed DNA polymerase